jgi:hypothetical protein
MKNVLAKKDKIKGLKIGPFSLVLLPSAFLISKDGNPYHLTIAFNNKKNHLDIHLKNQKDNSYETIFLMPYDEFFQIAEKIANRVVQLFLESMKIVKPGWLRKHRYYVFYKAEDEFLRLFKKHSIIISKKYHPNTTAILNNFSVEDAIFYPRILHELIIDDTVGYVFASQIQKRKNKQLLLIKLRRNERTNWYALPERKIKQVLENLLSPEIRKLVKENMEKISTTIKFEEFEKFLWSDHIY